MYHVTSAHNRESIKAHGLDWTRMGAAPGIAGSTRPEVPGIFLCPDRFEADWFAQMNNTGGAVDIWAVDGIDHDDLIPGGSGFSYVSTAIPASQLTLLERPATPAAAVG
jgi:hypothetical protein